MGAITAQPSFQQAVALAQSGSSAWQGPWDWTDSQLAQLTAAHNSWVSSGSPAPAPAPAGGPDAANDAYQLANNSAYASFAQAHPGSTYQQYMTDLQARQATAAGAPVDQTSAIAQASAANAPILQAQQQAAPAGASAAPVDQTSAIAYDAANNAPILQAQQLAQAGPQARYEAAKSALTIQAPAGASAAVKAAVETWNKYAPELYSNSHLKMNGSTPIYSDLHSQLSYEANNWVNTVKPQLAAAGIDVAPKLAAANAALPEATRTAVQGLIGGWTEYGEKQAASAAKEQADARAILEPWMKLDPSYDPKKVEGDPFFWTHALNDVKAQQNPPLWDWMQSNDPATQSAESRTGRWISGFLNQPDTTARGKWISGVVDDANRIEASKGSNNLLFPLALAIGSVFLGPEIAALIGTGEAGAGIAVADVLGGAESLSGLGAEASIGSELGAAAAGSSAASAIDTAGAAGGEGAINSMPAAVTDTAAGTPNSPFVQDLKDAVQGVRDTVGEVKGAINSAIPEELRPVVDLYQQAKPAITLAQQAANGNVTAGGVLNAATSYGLDGGVISDANKAVTEALPEPVAGAISTYQQAAPAINLATKAADGNLTLKDLTRVGGAVDSLGRAIDTAGSTIDAAADAASSSTSVPDGFPIAQLIASAAGSTAIPGASAAPANSGPQPGTDTPIQNSDGSVTTERSITVQDDRLNNGDPTNIPTVWDGAVVSEDQAVENAVSSGQPFQSFDTVEAAVQAAQQRSNDLAAGTTTSIGGASGTAANLFSTQADDDAQAGTVQTSAVAPQSLPLEQPIGAIATNDATSTSTQAAGGTMAEQTDDAAQIFGTQASDDADAGPGVVQTQATGDGEVAGTATTSAGADEGDDGDFSDDEWDQIVNGPDSSGNINWSHIFSGQGSGANGAWTTRDVLGALATGTGIATALRSLFDSTGRHALEAAGRASDAQAGLATSQARIANEQFDLWKTNALPMLQSLPGMAADRTAEETARAASGVQNQYAVARRNMRTALTTSGRSPADPSYAALLAPSYMDEGAKVSQAIDTARRAERERQQNVTMGAINAWSGLPAQSGNNMTAASTAQGNVARTQTSIANTANQNAAQGAFGGISLAGRNWLNSTPGATAPATNAATTYDPTFFNPGNDYGAAGGGVGAVPYRNGGVIKRYADGGNVGGGVISGPGTGTSDSVPMKTPEGTFILSDDTVRAIGHKKVHDLIEKSGVRPGRGGSSYGGIAIRASNGEAEIPPETVQFYGEEFFNKLQQKYHRPVLAGNSGDGHANGGVIRKRGLPKSVEDAIFHSMPHVGMGRG